MDNLQTFEKKLISVLKNEIKSEENIIISDFILQLIYDFSTNNKRERSIDKIICSPKKIIKTCVDKSNFISNRYSVLFD